MSTKAAVQMVGSRSEGERLRASLDAVGAPEGALRSYYGALLVVSRGAEFLQAIGIARSISLEPGPPVTPPGGAR